MKYGSLQTQGNWRPYKNEIIISPSMVCGLTESLIDFRKHKYGAHGFTIKLEYADFLIKRIILVNE